MANCINIFSYNARGLRDNQKRSETFKFLKDLGVDACMIQETHSTKEIEHLWRSEWGAQMLFSHGTSAARGVIIALRPGLHAVLKLKKSDDLGRILVAYVEIQNETFCIENIYAPNEDDPEFFIHAFSYLEGEDKPMVGGDFNLALDIKMDKAANNTDNKRKAREIVKAFMHDYDMIDVWREQHPLLKSFSWQNKSRLDYFLIPGPIGNQVKSCNMHASYRSDHKLLALKLLYSPQIRGKGLWRFNCSFLRDLTFVENVNNAIEETLIREQQQSPALKWEAIKNAIVLEATRFSINRAKARNRLTEFLVHKLDKLNEKLEKELENNKKKLILKDIRRTEDFMQEEMEKKSVGQQIQEWL